MTDQTDLIRAVLTAEAEWLRRAYENIDDKGYSDDLREGFRLAAGWVRFHAAHPDLVRVPLTW